MSRKFLCVVIPLLLLAGAVGGCDSSGRSSPSEFSFYGDGFAVSGRLVSPMNAVGTINVPDTVPGCTAANWWAEK